MTTSSFRRVLISVALASSAALCGCDISDSEEAPASSLAYGTDIGGAGCNILDLVTDQCATIPEAPPAFYVPGTHPRFTPAAKDLPLNTDIVFSGSTDGTASVTPANPDAPNAVEAALNDLDGWSTTAGFDIAFSGSIDPATVNDGTSANPMVALQQNVFLVPIESVSGGDPLDPADINAAAPFNPVNVSATRYITQVVSTDGGTNNVVRVSPTLPLQGPKKYLVIITNGIKDSNADPITASASYELLGVGDSTDCAAAGINAALVSLCDAIDGWEQLAVGYLQARNAQINTALDANVLDTNPATLKASLALTYTFTTTDPLSGLLGMGAPRAALFEQAYAARLAAGDSAATAGATAAGFVGSIASLLPTPQPRTVAIDSAAVIDLGYLDGDTAPLGGDLVNGIGKLYTGAITLPYYQSAPADSADTSFTSRHWGADTTLGATLGAALGTGPLPPADNDGTYNVTYRYPFAAATDNIKIPLQVTVPASGCAAGGCPVVIYIHGITSNRASVASLAYNLAANGVATVAIDLPLHGIPAYSSLLNYLNVGSHSPTQAGTQAALYGDTLANLYPGITERHFDFRMDSTGMPVPMDYANPTASDDSGTLFINLGDFANTHNNVQQGVIDLLNLNASLQNISTALINAGVSNGLNLGGLNPMAAQVYVTGVSLGGIVGSTYAAVNQAAIAADLQVYAATGNNTAFFPKLYPVKALVANTTGGELTRVLENSVAFAPSLLGGLDGQDGAIDGTGIVQGTSSFEKFMYVFQSLVDSGEPLNFVGLLTSDTLDLTASAGPDLRVPTLLQEIVGGSDLGDGAYPADLVVPNNAWPTTYQLSPWLGGIPAPLAGTDGLAAVLGLSTAAADGDVAIGAGGAAITELSIGYHTSLLTTSTTSCAAPLTCPDAGNTLATGELQTQVVSFILNDGSLTSTGTAGSGAAAPYTTTYTN